MGNCLVNSQAQATLRPPRKRSTGKGPLKPSNNADKESIKPCKNTDSESMRPKSLSIQNKLGLYQTSKILRCKSKPLVLQDPKENPLFISRLRYSLPPSPKDITDSKTEEFN